MEFKYLTDKEFEGLSEYQREKYLDEKRQHEVKAAKDAATSAAKEAAKEEVSGLTAELETVKGELKVIKDEADKTQTELEQYKTENNRIRVQAKENEKNGRHFEKALDEAIESKMDELKTLRTDKKAKIGFELKAVGDMGLNSITDLSVANAQMAPGIYGLPNRRVHMRDILNTGRMTTSDYHYLREVGGEGSVGTWAENSGKKPQIDLDYIEKIAPSQYIAGYLKISRKALDDIPALRSALRNRLLEKYLVAEDFQILNGDGVTPNLEGILPVAQPYVANADTPPYLVSRMIDAAGQLEEGTGGLTEGFYADGYILKPRDWARVANTVSQGSEQVFTLPGLGIVTVANGVLLLNGVPVYKMNGMPADRQFLVGDWNMGAQLLIREDPRIDFSYENEDDFVQNKITVRVEGRVALPIYYEGAFVKGDISDVEGGVEGAQARTSSTSSKTKA